MAKGIIFLYIRFVVSVQAKRTGYGVCLQEHLCYASVLSNTRTEGEA